MVVNHEFMKAGKTKTIAVLNKLLKTAVDWDVIERMPCVVRLLPTPKASVGFHEFDGYECLLEAAKSDARAHLIVLLGGEAFFGAVK